MLGLGRLSTLHSYLPMSDEAPTDPSTIQTPQRLTINIDSCGPKIPTKRHIGTEGPADRLRVPHTDEGP